MHQVKKLLKLVLQDNLVFEVWTWFVFRLLTLSKFFINKGLNQMDRRSFSQQILSVCVCFQV